MKTIEVLFSEFSNMYGETYNIKYLEKCNNNIKVIYTSCKEEPYFVNNKVDMVYIGNLRDNKMNIILEKLMPYKDKIKKMIENNIIFLLTGNSLELFGKYVQENGKKEETLGIFEYYTEKDFTKKHASWFKGEFNNKTIIAHRNQFSKCFNIKNPFIKVLNGFGSDLVSDNEGIKYKNFHATYLIGPFLIMNPDMTKYFLKLLKLDDKFAFEDVAYAAFNERLNYFSKEDARYIIEEHG